ncbi:MAG: Uma2 family endonuclease [Firmicutes bacterium]|nr:Uma2 family endonuclease [Bacillota bacterium]
MNLTFADFATKMSTMPRHGDIVSGFSLGLEDKWRTFYKKGRLVFNQENLNLAYTGSLADGFRLLDATQNFTEEFLDECSCVMPDVMIFMHNNLKRYRSKTLGYPDLVVEVWSDSNNSTEKDFKTLLYSTGKNTEHWYLTQHSNIIECWHETTKLSTQSLQNILVTQSGISFDLRHLAI